MEEYKKKRALIFLEAHKLAASLSPDEHVKRRLDILKERDEKVTALGPMR